MDETSEINEVFDWWDVEIPEEHTPVRRGPSLDGLVKFWELPENDGTDWHPDGLCYRVGFEDPAEADKWYANPGTHEEKEAATTCFECPVRLQCLKWACDVKDKEGTFGGLNARVRKRYGHDFDLLKLVDNPYNTDKKVSCYHEDKLKPHVERED